MFHLSVCLLWFYIVLFSEIGFDVFILATVAVSRMVDVYIGVIKWCGLFEIYENYFFRIEKCMETSVIRIYEYIYVKNVSLKELLIRNKAFEPFLD